MVRLFPLFIFLLALLIHGEGPAQATADIRRYSRLSVGELYERGDSAYKANDYEKARQILMVICSRYDEDDKAGEQYVYAQSFSLQGNICYNTDRYPEAMDFYLRARKIAERYGFEDVLGYTLGRIGNVYASNSDYESAVNFYERALAYAQKTGNDNLKSMLTNNLVAANYYKGDMEAAADYNKLFKELHYTDDRYRYDVVLNQSLLFHGSKLNDSARVYAQKAIRYAIEDSLSVLCVAGANSSIAQYFEDDNQLDSALHYLHANESIARKTGSDELLLSTLKDLARIYDKCQMTRTAMEYKSEYLAIFDSTFSQREFNSLKNKQVLYEMERDAATISSLNVVRTLQRNGILILSIALVVFIVLIFVLYAQQRKMKAAWRDLYERNRHQLAEETNYKQRIQMLEKTIERLEEAKEKPVENEELPTAGRKLVMQQEQRDRIARDILHVMENTEDYCSAEYSLDKLASSIGSNARYVSEVLNDVFGKSFRTMLNEYRIKKAMIRLGDIENYGKYTIKAISEGVGYKSQATFISAFMKFTGLKPGMYQKLAIERHHRDGENQNTVNSQ